MKHFKQFLFGALAMVASALLFTSCVDNLSEDYNLAEGVVKLIPCTVTAQNADNTKVSLDYNKQQRFESGDQLYVKGEQLEGTLDLVSGGGKTTATFQGMLTYTGSGSEPSPELALDLKLISVGDAIGNTEFLGGIASSMTEAVSKFSTLTAQITYGQLNNTTNPTTLSEGTAFVDFTATLNPAPGNGDYEAVLFINGGSTRLGAAEVEVLNGTTTFALAFPGGTTLNKPMVSILGQNFKFGGNNPTVEAAKIYYVNKTNNNDLLTPVTIEAITAGVVRVSIPKEFADEAIYGPYPAFPRFGCLSYVITDSDDAVVEEGSIGRDGQIQTKGDEDPSTKFNIVEIPVRAGDKVSFYGNNHMYLFVDPRYFDESIDEETRDKYYSPELEPDDMLALNITCPQASYIYGNVMSLVDSAGFATKTGFTQDLEVFALAGIFNGYRHGGNHIIFHNTRKLLLPAAELTDGCYAGMFGKCTLMEKTPDLPAYELAPGCYIGMFSGCSSLRTVPDFHVKEWPEAACMYMFNDCSSLVNPPALDADSNVVGGACFCEMFESCENLTTAPALPFTTLQDGCYMAMFEGCERLAAAPALPATELAEYCYAGMFSGCSNLRTVPILNAETMETDCYSGMFSGCTSLTTPPALPATTLAPGCYSYMFEGCTDLDTAPTLSVETLQVNCYEGMFRDCIHLTKAPELPAPTLVQACYTHMFTGCSSLNYIKCLATDISAEDCTYEWVQDVAPTGTFVEAPGMMDWDISVNGIPIGWRNPYAIPLTLQAVNDATTITFTNPLNKTIDYDINGHSRHSKSAASFTVSLNAGDCLMLYGSNDAYASEENWTFDTEDPAPTFTNIQCSDDCYIYGNVMSLINQGDFATLAPLTKPNTFYGLFADLSSQPAFHLRNHPTKDILLPATALTRGCYAGMFAFSGISRVPELPAEVVQSHSYCTMFTACPNLVTVPEDLLPATYLAPYCYAGMFGMCTNLTNTPNFPAATTYTGSYSTMFYECYALESGPSVFDAENIADYCCDSMFEWCRSLRYFPGLSATTVGKRGYWEMFRGCDNLGSAPDIYATTLSESCMGYMFADCNNLTSSSFSLPAETLAPYCYSHMFANCPNLSSSPNLPATELAEGCYYYMFSQDNGEPANTAITSAPYLPASILVNSCYAGMFKNCESLCYINCQATDISATDCTSDWVANVAPTGTFYRHEDMTSWAIDSDNGIPVGWTIEPPITVDDLHTPLTLKAVSSGTITVTIPSSVSVTMKYRLNEGEMQEFNSGASIDVDADDEVSFFGDNAAYASSDYYDKENEATRILCSSDCYVYGNIMSLIDSDGFATVTDLTESYTFAGLFEGNTHLLMDSGKKLLLPATNLAEGCYVRLFAECSSLATAPELPAMTAVDWCYDGMFNSCTSLTTAPALPATEVAEGSYCGMFWGCTNLTTAPPVLPAATLASSCYEVMFRNCTSLEESPVIAATSCGSSESGFYEMFRGCSSLTRVTCLMPDSGLGSSFSWDWLRGVPDTGTFVKSPSATWPSAGAYGIPANWTIVNAD